MATKDSSPIKQQLALAMQRNDAASFADFCWTGNELLQQQIQSLLDVGPQSTDNRILYIWAARGSGKSHILQASCQALAEKDQSIAYLPLKLLHDLEPGILEGMAEHAGVAIDDIDVIAGHKAWEEAVFHLYNQLQAQQKILMISGLMAPAVTPLHLADLRSRLSHALIFQIHELQDEDKIATLQGHALQRGLELPKAVGQYILSRCARNMQDLQAILDRLDHASLVEQRKLTIPFVKSILRV
jgi:DnaA family protein